MRSAGLPKGDGVLSSSLPGALIAAAVGACLALLNFAVTRRAALKADGSLLGLAPVLRMAVDVGYLAAVYFLAPHTPWDRTWLLAGAAAGVTVPLFILTPLLVREVNRRSSGSRTEDGTAHDRAGNSDPPKGGDA